MRTILPPFMCRKIGLTPNAKDKKTGGVTAALLRSRRHQSPEGQPENVVALVYELNQDERTAIAEGAPLIIGNVTYGNPPTEMLVHVGVDSAAEYYGVEEATPERLEENRLAAENELTAATENYHAVLAARTRAAESGNEGALDSVRIDMAKALQRIAKALRGLGEANVAAGFGAE
jgi:hypothetical protein